MHIYAFGSVCRGDVSADSDVDLLAIVEGDDSRFDPNVYSIYSYKRIQELWEEGNPFAWHLWQESRLLFSPDNNDYLKALGSPKPYRHCVRDCEKFLALFCEGYNSAVSEKTSKIFDLSTIYLSIRNLASCFSLGVGHRPNFSRNSALCLGTRSLRLPVDSYRVLERARILCTRGQGENIMEKEINTTVQRLHEVREWMNNLIDEAKKYERIQ
ncbi:MAG: nucleotidyltransferase [Acidobacteria bacterium 13_2_20CM_2_57_12]|nr:MAG: nucleotidyltransferase [Acidobacteria bacterium 13_2_20CM_2_57_12]